MILKQESERGRTRREALLRFLAIFTPLFLLAACGHAVGVLVPVADNVPGTTITDLLVVTTRKPSGNPGTLYNGKRDPQFSLDEIKVSIPPDKNRKIGEIQWPKRLPANPATDFATVAVDHLPPTRKAASAWLGHNLPKSRDVLVFVHGFNNTYEDAVYRFAQIFHDSKTDAAPVLFTWPSAAKLFDYNYDRESTIYSRDALENLLKGLAQDPRVHEVSILAHSMGTWLAMESLRQMAIRDGRVAPKIRNVIFASPDIDVDVFARQWRDLGKARPKFTIFVSQDDRALAVSRFIAGKRQPPRADQPRTGALQERHREKRHHRHRSDEAQDQRQHQPREICREPRGRSRHRHPARRGSDADPIGDRAWRRNHYPGGGHREGCRHGRRSRGERADLDRRPQHAAQSQEPGGRSDRADRQRGGNKAATGVGYRRPVFLGPNGRIIQPMTFPRKLDHPKMVKRDS